MDLFEYTFLDTLEKLAGIKNNKKKKVNKLVRGMTNALGTITPGVKEDMELENLNNQASRFLR